MFKNYLVLIFVLIKKIDKSNSLSVQNDHEPPLSHSGPEANPFLPG